MKVYLVGGAVRDSLLGLPVADKDWVVVGATPEIMINQGFRPVGQDFPVFIHPTSHEEYALARIERKTGKGYSGFSFHADQNVSLEEDLARRDLTINAMAEDQYGNIIDPYKGQEDLKNGILRHVSSAFSEDPVRILRTARFAARYGFKVANETMILMQKMVTDGEVDALVAERVWQELAKGLMEKNPLLMIDVLYQSGALKKILPEISALIGTKNISSNFLLNKKSKLNTINIAARMKLSLPERYAALLIHVNEVVNSGNIQSESVIKGGMISIDAINKRLKVPKTCGEVAMLVYQWHRVLKQVDRYSAEIIVEVLKKIDAFRRKDRFSMILNVVTADMISDDSSIQYIDLKKFWLTLLTAASDIDSEQIVKRFENDPKFIAAAIEQARIDKIIALV